jgi:16S rRNA pseudouridine516 synthase
MRLDKFVAQATGLSRRQVHDCIRGGDILVNGILATPELRLGSETVTLNGELLAQPTPVYLIIHKPPGYVCANRDSQHPTVLDLLAGKKFHPVDPLQVVGRLDLDTSGILLLTTDGDWNHRITSPSSHCAKSYRVWLETPPTQLQINTLEAGILLHSEKKPTAPCKIEIIQDNQVNIHLNEGKYHQVKRMFAAVGNRVIQLHRWRIGGLELDSQLLAGHYRHLTPAEINAVFCRG